MHEAHQRANRKQPLTHFKDTITLYFTLPEEKNSVTRLFYSFKLTPMYNLG